MRTKFKNTPIKVIEHYGGTIGEDKDLVLLKELKSAGRNNETASTEEIKTAQDHNARDRIFETSQQTTLWAADH